jgi:hypothetical protein
MTQKQAKRGGARPGSGKPRKFGKHLTERLTATVKHGTKKRIRRDLAKGQSLSDWVNRVIADALK